MFGTTGERPVLFREPLSVRASLVTALEGHRLSEGRFIGGFAPVPQELVAPKSFSPDLLRVAALAQKAWRREPSPQARADLAILALAGGKVDSAVTELEQAVEEKPDDATLLADLAAAYLARAGRKSQPFDFARAGAAARRATERDPDLPEAWFNLALALEKLNARGKAVAAWETYHGLDASSPWSKQASDHLAHLRAPAHMEKWERLRKVLGSSAGDSAAVREIVAGSPQNIREHVERELLGRWADLWNEGRHVEAARHLALLREVGQALVSLNGERIVQDSVTAIDRAESAGDRSLLGALAEGHRRYREGVRAYQRFDLSQARTDLTSARDHLRRAGSPMAGWAAFFLAVCDYQEERRDAALSSLATLRRDSPGERYPSLLARIDWVEGLIRMQQGDLMTSLGLFTRSADRFERIHETGHAGSQQHFLAECYELLGETEQAWDHLYLALRATDEIADLRRVQAIFAGAAFTLDRSEETAALARDFDDEAVDAARRAGNPAPLAVALTSRATRAGDAEQVSVDLAAAKQEAARIQEEVVREGLLADIEAARGEWLSSVDPAEAIHSLTAAFRFDSRSGYALRRIRLYRARAEAFRRTGEQDRAESDLRAGFAEVERQRALVLDDVLRTSYFEEADTLLDEMLTFLWSRGSSDAALFDIVEAGRARTLLDLVQEKNQPARPASLDTVQSGVPAGTALVEYALLDDRLLAWVIASGKSHRIELPFDSSAVRGEIRSLRRDLAGGSASERGDRAATALWERLVLRLTPYLPVGADLVFVPDGILHEVPFAALRSPRTGRLLVEDHAVSVAPSATLYLMNLRSSCERTGFGARALAVGNPAFDEGIFPDLDDLPGALSEARAVAKVWPGTDLLLGKEATRGAFLSSIGRYAIVHLAGHAIVNSRAPLFSRLVLAPEADGSDLGVLYAHEIYGRSFARTRLVFLSGCGTAAGRTLEGEGALTLARPFLAAGVPAVIGSLQKIGDRKAALFSDDFYRSLRDGATPLGAFHAAQIAGLRRDPRSKTWAAFQFQGASCPDSAHLLP